ncbi:encapsulin [Streptomyces monticola]|uniref:Encapsulin n=1 Tax=Streptomyces monticola TaxID=2666263 RepID=A0ABW2JM87_9ACTN
MEHGRDKLPAWTQAEWDTLDRTVHEEMGLTKVYPRLLTMYGPLNDPWATTVAAEIIDRESMSIPEEDKTNIAEVQVRFALSQSQVAEGNGLSTALTLVTRAANLLALGLDTLVWDGAERLPAGVQIIRGKTAGAGLVAAAQHTIKVFPTELDPATKQPRYGEATFAAVAEATALLEAAGHARPFGMVLDHRVFADAFRPLRTSLVTPADRITPLVTRGFCPTARVPEMTGLVLSSRASTVDFVAGLAAVTGYLQANADGTHLFRVFERFAVRLKDPSALVRLEFQTEPEDDR